MSQQTRVRVVSISRPALEEEIEKTFELNDLSAALVTLSNISGPITVEAWDDSAGSGNEQPRVWIRAVKSSSSPRAFERTRTELTQDGDQIRAETIVDDTAPSGWPDLLRRDEAAKVEYTVRVPAACAVSAEDVNGSIAMSGLEKKTKAQSVNGAVLLKRLKGAMEASTTNGRISAENISGAAHFSAVNGSIDFDGAQLQTLDAHTVSGSIRAALTIDPSGQYTFKSTNGSCELIIPSASRCDIEMEGINGRAECTVPNTKVNAQRGPAFLRWSAKLNGGGAPIRFKTVNGSLRVLPSDESVSEAEPPVNGAPQPDRGDESRVMEILRAVERGEMSVDDALEKI